MSAGANGAGPSPGRLPALHGAARVVIVLAHQSPAFVFVVGGATAFDVAALGADLLARDLRHEVFAAAQAACVQLHGEELT